MNTRYVPPHRREEATETAPAPAPTTPGSRGKGRGVVAHHVGKGSRGGKGRGYRRTSTNPDIADIRQTSGSWDSTGGEAHISNFKTFVKQPIVSQRESTLMRAVDTAAQYLLRQQQEGNISLTHMRVKLVLGEIAYKRHNKAKKTREDLTTELLQGVDRKQTEFRTTLIPSNVDGVIDYFEKMGFVKQTPTDNIEKQRRWQIYMRMKKRRSHIAYVSHDGHNIKIRKLLVSEENTAGYLKMDVFDNCGPPPQDWRLRLERHPLSHSDTDEAVRKWILDEVVVNAAGNLCPPLHVSDVSFDCIRRKYKSPDPTVPKTQCTGIWKRGTLKLQIQYVEQTVSESFRGETNPGYELHISHEGLTRELHHTRWVERMSRPLNIYKLSVMLSELLLPVFDIDGRLVNGDLTQKVFNTIEENPIPLSCSLLGITYCEETGRAAMTAEEAPFFEKLQGDLRKAREEDQIRFIRSRPCYVDWNCDGASHKNATTYTCLSDLFGKVTCSKVYGYPAETSIYFECKVSHLRNDGKVSIGWSTPNGATTHTYSEPASNVIIGTQLDFVSGQILFWSNADQIPLTSEYDFVKELKAFRGNEYQPIIEIFNSSVELINEIEPLQEGFSREPTPLIQPDVYAEDDLVASPYDDENDNGIDSDDAAYPYVKNPKESTDPGQCEEIPLPKENFIAFDNLSKPWMQIGVGGFGAVYKCLHREYSDDVAIKELKTCSSPQSRRKFQKEIIDLMKVSKYGKLLLCIGWSESQTGTLYMITEYCTEGSLTDKLKSMEDSCDVRDRVSVALEVGISIAQALTHLHSDLLNYVHLDVAARNVLIQRGPAYKLGDMGLLALEGSPCPVICIPWSPPEMVLIQSSERKATKPHDCWSFGCLLYEIITGREPYWHIRGVYGGETTPVKTYMSGNKVLPLRPEDVPPVLSSIWEFMERSLWNLDPALRPKLNEVVVKLQDLRKDIQLNYGVFTEEHSPTYNVTGNSDFNQAHTADPPAPPAVTANPSHFMSMSAAPSKPKPAAKTFRKRRGKN